MANLQVPKARDFGWELKPVSSVYFEQVTNKSGQICVVLEHSLLRGVTAEMIFWWFRHFPNMQVTLEDIEGYKGVKVPAYYLWHPSDHVSAKLQGQLGPNNTSKVGAKIHIQEVMQYEKYGTKYSVDQALEIFYYQEDGWAMGKSVPFIGNLMVLRISFKDVYEAGTHIGVHYHYEIVAGTNKRNFIARMINNKVIGNFGVEFFDAWLTHNTIEVGVFENFLPPLFEQRDNLKNLRYSKQMNPVQESPANQTGFNKAFFDERVKGYQESVNAFDYQQATSKSIL